MAVDGGEFQVCKVGSLVCVCACMCMESGDQCAFLICSLVDFPGLWRNSYFFFCVAVERVTEKRSAQSLGRDGKIRGGGDPQSPFCA